jgi:starch phosphorylase
MNGGEGEVRDPEVPTPGLSWPLVEPFLDPQARPCGFALRFASYRGATPLLRDPERLRNILTNHQRPVQIIFCMVKAHPDDQQSKLPPPAGLQGRCRQELRGEIAFVEDYDQYPRPLSWSTASTSG